MAAIIDEPQDLVCLAFTLVAMGLAVAYLAKTWKQEPTPLRNALGGAAWCFLFGVAFVTMVAHFTGWWRYFIVPSAGACEFDWGVFILTAGAGALVLLTVGAFLGWVMSSRPAGPSGPLPDIGPLWSSRGLPKSQALQEDSCPPQRGPS